MGRMLEVEKPDQAIDRLLSSDSPSIRYWTLRDLLGKSEDDEGVVEARGKIQSWAPVQGILREQHADGYWGEPEDVYWPKWRATVWPLILLAEMGVPGDLSSVKRGCEYFLRAMDGQDRSWPPNFPENDPARKWDGYRSVWEPCVTGNMARTLTAFGFSEDSRVREMYEWLVRTQLPDGGWNCEPGPWHEKVFHSSFMSTIEPLWAFSELPPQNWPKGGREAVERACEFMLIHRLYKSDKTGKVIQEEWTKLHFPLFYFYDVLHGLRVLTALGFGKDERTKDASDLLVSKRLPDGTWPMEDSYVNSPRGNLVKDPVSGDWAVVKGEGVTDIPVAYSTLGQLGDSNPWITLNVLRVFRERNG
jgi:hypothetical protein